MPLWCDIYAPSPDYDFAALWVARPHQGQSRSPGKAPQREFLSLVFHTDPAKERIHVQLPPNAAILSDNRSPKVEFSVSSLSSETSLTISCSWRLLITCSSSVVSSPSCPVSRVLTYSSLASFTISRLTNELSVNAGYCLRIRFVMLGRTEFRSTKLSAGSCLPAAARRMESSFISGFWYKIHS